MEQAGHRNDGTDEEYEESFWCLSEFVPLVINDMYGVQEGEVVFWHWGLKGRGCKFHLFICVFLERTNTLKRASELLGV